MSELDWYTWSAEMEKFHIRSMWAVFCLMSGCPWKLRLVTWGNACHMRRRWLQRISR